MRHIGGATFAVALATFLLTACGGGGTATSTPAPAATVAAPTEAASPASAAAGVAAVAGSATTAHPTTPQGSPVRGTPPARATGTIAAINGATFTVTQRDSTMVTVTTDPSTRYSTLVASNVAAIAVGDVVTVQGASAGGTVTATAITDSGAQPPGGAGQRPTSPAGGTTGRTATRQPQPTRPAASDVARGGNAVTGTVQQVSGTTLTIAMRGGGTTTVTTSAGTKVTARRSGTFADVRVGDQVTAIGATGTGSAGAFTAASVADQTAH